MSLGVAEIPFSKMGSMTATDTRKWAMTRVAAGDYICLSNDQQTVWRFHQHIDGRSLGLICNYDERTFWRACYMTIEKAKALGPKLYESDRWDERVWIESDWHLPSRKAAVERMLNA